MVIERFQTRRQFAALAAGALFAGLSLVGCASGSGGTSGINSGAVGAVLESRDLMGSADACEVRVGLIMGPPSMGLTQFLVAARNNRTFNDFTFEFNDVDYIGLSAKLNQGDYDIATLPSNIGPILYSNAELKNDYQVISVNNLGVLYMLTTDASIKTLRDLVGRRVYSYGECGTPE